MRSADRTFADELLALGQASGLAAVGIAAAQPFDRARTAIADRAERGFDAGMSFTFRKPHRSCDPTQSLPGAQSLVVGAYGYRRADDSAPPENALQEEVLQEEVLQGRIARYTWADRYEPLKHGLSLISKRLRAEGWRTRILADDNSLVDREAAYQAGLGWYGKNANLLLPEHGSWFLLGSVLTDAPLVDARPPSIVADGCGPCERCLPACPTGAIVAPGVVDGARCLSWLLQAPGVFPFEYRVALGDRLYGCDECQEVCPINRAADRRHPPAPAEPGDQPVADLLRVLRGDDVDLLQSFGRWYLPAREARYVRRNALVVLGNALAEWPERAWRPEIETVLVACLSADDWLVRAHAVWTAGHGGRGDLLAALASAETEQAVRAELERWPTHAAGAAGGG